MDGNNNSVRIAYLILCHIDPEFVAHTVKTLKYENDVFFIHVDKKTDIVPFIESIEDKENVYFVEKRVRSYWGGFNAIIAIMKMIELAKQHGDFNRFVLLQGQDYPLFSPQYIHSFFENHIDIEFCKAVDCSNSTRKGDYMKCGGFWLKDIPRCLRIFDYAFTKINSLGIKYRSCYYEGMPIYHGWAHFALTKECVDYVFDFYNKTKSYNRFMKHRFPPDESYFHTLIHNSHFKEKVDNKTIYNRDGNATLLNLTYFEYPDQVVEFRDKEDYYWLKETGCLFARKINSKSKELIEEIDRNIRPVS